MYGIDRKNRFWTDDFLDNREDVFVKVEYYEDDAPHQFPTNSTETLKKYETS